MRSSRIAISSKKISKSTGHETDPRNAVDDGVFVTWSALNLQLNVGVDTSRFITNLLSKADLNRIGGVVTNNASIFYEHARYAITRRRYYERIVEANLERTGFDFDVVIGSWRFSQTEVPFAYDTRLVAS